MVSSSKANKLGEKDEVFSRMLTGVRNEFKSTPSNRGKESSSSKKRPALGRGLSSLMGLGEVSAVEDQVDKEESAQVCEPEAKVEKKPAVITKVAKEIEATKVKEEPEEVSVDSSPMLGLHYVRLEELVANPNQPRKEFIESDISSLAESIKGTGLIQPIVARALHEQAENGAKYEIVAGERRFRAAGRAGLEKVPVLIKELSEREVVEIAIVENVQRRDLNPIEEALAYQRLQIEFELSQTEIATTVGKDRASISNILRLLKLEPEVQKLISQGSITSGHARALLMAPAGKERLDYVEQIISGGLSVRESESLIAQDRDSSSEAAGSKAASGGKKYRKSALETDIEARLRRTLGTKVSVSIKEKGSGELKLSFFSKDELNSLLERLES